MSDLVFYAIDDLLKRSKTDESARFDLHATMLKQKVTIKAFIEEGKRRGVFK